MMASYFRSASTRASTSSTAGSTTGSTTAIAAPGTNAVDFVAAPRAASTFRSFAKSPRCAPFGDDTVDTSSFATDMAHRGARAGSRTRSVDWAADSPPPSMSSTPRSSLNLARSGSGRAKLHKNNAPSQSHFTTPYATYEESHLDLASAAAPSKPRLRKPSLSKEDQGCLDLSKSLQENDRLTGLGIHDFSSARSVSDVSFAHTVRTKHDRSISMGSQASSGSGSSRPGQPYTHPMKQSPRSHTPPAGLSYRSSFNFGNIDETSDQIDEEPRFGHAYRSRRSTSVSSTAPNHPTPLSQSHTPDELGEMPKLTSASQTNLSLHSDHSSSAKPVKLQKVRPPAHSTWSVENGTSPISRTSFDKALSFASRRSESEMPSQDELVRAARRKFDEKEAHKDRKHERENERRRQAEEAKTVKREERERHKQADQAARRPSMPALSYSVESATSSISIDKRRLRRSRSGSLRTMSYDSSSRRPLHDATVLPPYVEKANNLVEHDGKRAPSKSAKSVGLSWWFHTRVLGCGAVS